MDRRAAGAGADGRRPLGGFADFYKLGSFGRLSLAWRVFGRDRVDGEIRRIRTVLAGSGYQLGREDDQLLPMVVCQALLLNRNPHVEDLATALFERIRAERLLPAARGNTLHAMQRAVAELGPPNTSIASAGERGFPGLGGMGGALVRHLHAHAPVHGSLRATLFEAGRWIEAEHPEAADPADWTRKTCATWVAAVDRMKVGDYLQRTASLTDRLGKPMEAPSKAEHLTAIRTSSAISRSGSGYPGTSTRSGRWAHRAASPRCSARTRTSSRTTSGRS
ncbi:hypothetical protein [Streptomyces fractus]|uniref:hypothetical protein n=1 Tax=Streptomyces fractus TaxID=641806 RepID=UPI003CE6EC48